MKKPLTFLFIFCCILITENAFAQRVKVSNLNKNIQNSSYKFSFVQITDIHVGEGIDDYGTPGFIGDTMPSGDIGYAAIKLRKTVNWINKNAKKRDIRFVIVTGDLTDSGEKSEFDKANEILSTLVVPFVPLIGNHDVKAHNHLSEVSYFNCDSLSNVVFKNEFDTLQHFFDEWNDGFRQQKVYSTYSENTQFLQNYFFSYKGFGFIAFDLNPRFAHGRPKSDNGPRPRLNDFPNGSFDWLMNTLKTYQNKGVHNIFLLTHQAPHHGDLMSKFNGLITPEYDKITKALLPYQPNLAFWLAGHTHRNKSYKVKTLNKKFVLRARETGSNKRFQFKNGMIRIVKVYEAK